MLHPHDPDFYNVALLLFLVAVPSLLIAAIYDAIKNYERLITSLRWKLAWLFAISMSLVLWGIVLILYPLMWIMKRVKRGQEPTI
jgi:hypothetical protein